MENNNLGSKKINGTQKNIDESKGKNIPHDREPHNSEIKKEIVADKSGNKEVVDRARNENEVIKETSKEINPENPNANRGVSSEEEAKKRLKTRI